VGTLRHNDGGAAMAEEIVNALKNRLTIVDWRDLLCLPPATASWQLPGPDLHRLAKYERHVGHVISITSQPLYCRGSHC
jgi:hypothetical protein